MKIADLGLELNNELYVKYKEELQTSVNKGSNINE